MGFGWDNSYGGFRMDGLNTKWIDYQMDGKMTYWMIRPTSQILNTGSSGAFFSVKCTIGNLTIRSSRTSLLKHQLRFPLSLGSCPGGLVFLRLGTVVLSKGSRVRVEEWNIR